jgi:anti-anti-sigma factor
VAESLFSAVNANFEIRQEGDVLVVEIGGRLTLGEPVDRFREIATASPKVVLNLSGLEYLDSAGLGEMISVNRQTAVRLVSVPKRVRDLLQLTGSQALFNIQPDEQAAITSFR